MKNIKTIALLLIFITGCATLGEINFQHLYGTPQPKTNQVAELNKADIDYWQDVEPIIESRCVVCHACYDAPCQLKMSSIEGIERGASKDIVYNGTRLTAAPLTRLHQDAFGVEAWRNKKFHSVVNEYPSNQANLTASLIYRMIELKDQAHAYEQNDLIDEDDIPLNIDASYSCPQVEEFSIFADLNPEKGMPYGLPKLDNHEYGQIKSWLSQGAKHTKRAKLPSLYQQNITQWEAFLNQDSLKSQLSSRYIYEHLFLGNLYFSDIAQRQYFKLVRSSTPAPEPIRVIATRRPYDDPKVARAYYRLQPVIDSIVSKTHMPYALNPQRMALWQKLFIDADYEVKQLPSYEVNIAANPFVAYYAIPINSRYQFMLDEAQFIIQGFIKGPVCHGQVALNVINDQFWVFFIEPQINSDQEYNHFLYNNHELLELPASKDEIFLPLSNWLNYQDQQKDFFAKRDKYISNKQQQSLTEEGKNLLNLDIVWNGDPNSQDQDIIRNNNAALTVFRHYNSATVAKGLIGDTPKTAWLIGYTQLERIHYLLAAGFDVYGNLGHQLLSRVYMDFLRMESEANFLQLLPSKSRKEVREYWYRDADKNIFQYLTLPNFEKQAEPAINYQTATANGQKLELIEQIKQHINHGLNHKYDHFTHPELAKLKKLPNLAIQQLSEVTILQVPATQTQPSTYYTFLRNKAHKNMTSIFNENNNRLITEDTLTVVQGIIGSYPNTFWKVEAANLTSFIDELSELTDDNDYQDLMDHFGIRRTHPDFWAFSDKLHQDYQVITPNEAGWLDFNRLENR